MAEHTKVYVIECMSPKHWYVGSTYRELHARIEEHREGFGCVWTQRHGRTSRTGRARPWRMS